MTESEAMLERVAAALKRRGFEAYTCRSGLEARAIALAAASESRVVGIGGAETLKQIGVPEALTKAGKTLVRETPCDGFMLSANALQEHGRKVNSDGNGNRVAASIHGADQVVYVVGRNKIVAGGVDEAIARIKRFACPPNCRRLGKKTPCAATGVCADCDSPDRICKVTVVMDRKPTGTHATVILVNEDLGY